MARRAKGEVMEIGVHVRDIDRPEVHGVVTRLAKCCRFCPNDMADGQIPFCRVKQGRRCQAGPWHVSFMGIQGHLALLWGDRQVHHTLEARDVELYVEGVPAGTQLTFGFF